MTPKKLFLLAGLAAFIGMVIMLSYTPESKSRHKPKPVEVVEFKPLILPISIQICREACVDTRLYSITNGDVNLGSSETDIVTSVDKYCRSLMEDSTCFKVGNRRGDKDFFDNDLQFHSSSLSEYVAIRPNISEPVNETSNP